MLPMQWVQVPSLVRELKFYMPRGTAKKKIGIIVEPSRLFSEKTMASHSSTLAWKIPWMEEPGRLQSLRPLRVGHN